jgi:hypothetical protein
MVQDAGCRQPCVKQKSRVTGKLKMPSSGLGGEGSHKFSGIYSYIRDVVVSAVHLTYSIK